MMWAWHESKKISLRTGKLIKARSIEQKISLVKGFLSHRYGFPLVSEAIRLRSLLKKMRSEDPLDGKRRKRRGLRRRHFRKLYEAHDDIRSTSAAATSQWAAATTAWHIFARGGELENVKRKDLTFHSTNKGQRYAQLLIRPLKKSGGRAHTKIPQLIAELPNEQWEPYAALTRLVALQARDNRGPNAPLFEAAPGKPLTTGRFRGLLKSYAKLLGFRASEFGAHSARIGGATDLAATGSTSELLLQAKGRWASDIGRIYARMTRRAHLAASHLMHKAKGRDLEEILPGFIQMA